MHDYMTAPDLIVNERKAILASYLHFVKSVPRISIDEVNPSIFKYINGFRRYAYLFGYIHSPFAERLSDVTGNDLEEVCEDIADYMSTEGARTMLLLLKELPYEKRSWYIGNLLLDEMIYLNSNISVYYELESNDFKNHVLFNIDMDEEIVVKSFNKLNGVIGEIRILAKQA